MSPRLAILRSEVKGIYEIIEELKASASEKYKQGEGGKKRHLPVISAPVNREFYQSIEI